MIKRYACHITAHTPVEAMRDLRHKHGFGPDDIQAVTVAGSPRMAGVNNILAPKDRLIAQFSIPFCMALSMVRNPVDPDSFDEGVVADPAILAWPARSPSS